MELFVTAPPALVPLLFKEIQEMGIAQARQMPAGVYVPREIKWVYRINYRSRFATRVLWPLSQFSCKHRDELYDAIYEIPWPRLFSLDKTFAIDANVTSSTLRHSLFASQVVKDAICDRFRKEKGARPSVDISNPDIQLNLYVQESRGMISFDTSGAPLQKRGWRTRAGVAPLQETLAAAVLQLSSFSPTEIFCDPFCGSGTFLIEAACHATKTPAGYFRKNWGFFHHTLFSEQAWQQEKNEANSQIIPLEPGTIFGADKDPKAYEMCLENLKTCGFDKAIDLACKDIRSYFPTKPPTQIISNPPYGKRMQSSQALYQAFGHFFKTQCAKGAKAHLLCPERHLVEASGLKIEQEISLVSGGLDLMLFELS